MTTRRKTRIPRQMTDAQAADFYDRHSLEDLDPRDIEPIETPEISTSPAIGLTVRFPKEIIEQVRTAAKVLGKKPTQLVREWTIERLTLEQEAGSLARPESTLAPSQERAVRARVIASVNKQLPTAIRQALQDMQDTPTDSHKATA